MVQAVQLSTVSWQSMRTWVKAPTVRLLLSGETSRQGIISVDSAAVYSILAEYEDLGEGSYSAAAAVRLDELSRK